MTVSGQYLQLFTPYNGIFLQDNELSLKGCIRKYLSDAHLLITYRHYLTKIRYISGYFCLRLNLFMSYLFDLFFIIILIFITINV